MLSKLSRAALICLLAIVGPGYPMDENSAAGIPPLVGLLQGLEYGKPILGIRAPLGFGERDSGLCLPGLVTIQKASIEPAGEGIWKTAFHPELMLEDVRIEGSGHEISRVLRQMQGGWPAGVKIHKLEIFWKTHETNHLHADLARFQQKEIFLEKGWIKLGGKTRELKHLDLRIFQSSEKPETR